MTWTLSVDLCERVVAAVAAGASQHTAAKRFGVSVASASRWCGQMRETGDVAPKPRGGDQHSHAIEAQSDVIRTLYEERPTLFLWELRDALAERGIVVSQSSLSRFFKRHAITRKKNTAHAAEQQRPDVKAEREDWFEAQDELDLDSLVFLDETATATNMVRRYGRATCWQRCRVAVPHGHYKTTTVTACLRTNGIVAPWLLDGAMNGSRFRTYVEQVLVPVLQPGDTLILDNLPGELIRRLIYQ